MDQLDLFLSTNVLLFEVLTILMHHVVLFFSIFCQKNKIYVKKKNNTLSSCKTFFFVFYVGWTYILFKRLIIYQCGITMNIINT